MSADRFARLNAWMHSAPDKVVRFPIFNVNTPGLLIAEAAAKFNRTVHWDLDTGLVILEPRRLSASSRKSA